MTYVYRYEILLYELSLLRIRRDYLIINWAVIFLDILLKNAL